MKKTILLFALYSSAAIAADVRLGPEVPVTPVVMGAAPYNQTAASVASNGDGYVAVWLDTRQQSPEGPTVVASPGGVTIAYSRIDHAAGDVPRIFTRVLVRSDASPLSRRRGVQP